MIKVQTNTKNLFLFISRTPSWGKIHLFKIFYNYSDLPPVIADLHPSLHLRLHLLITKRIFSDFELKMFVFKWFRTLLPIS